MDCSSLETISIPSSVTYVGGALFTNCPRLAETRIRLLNMSDLTTNAINARLAGIRRLFIGESEISVYSIPDGVRNVGEDAFLRCSGLTSITIPEGVLAIGRNAFSDCSGLTSITIPNSVTNVGENAFSGCSRLASIMIGAGISSLTNLPFDVEYIHVDGSSPFYSERSGVLFDNAGTELLRYPKKRTGAYEIPDGVKTIGAFAFDGCSRLSSVAVPDGMTTIGNFAFSGCSGLSSITVPDSVTNIGACAFSGCVGCTYILLPPRFEGQTDTFDIPPGCVVVFGSPVNSGAAVAGTSAPIMLASDLSAAWSEVEDASSSDGTCLKSGDVVAGGESRLSMPVLGPGTFSFKWKISAGRGDYCRFFLDGTETNDITRSPDWTMMSLPLEAGAHVLEWAFVRGTGSATGQNAAFLDDLDWHPAVTLRVSSEFGECAPGRGSNAFLYGDRVSASAAEPTPANGTRRVCTGWTGGGSVPASGTGTNVVFSIHQPSSLIWNWRTDHWIAVSVSGGTTDFSPRWVEEGQMVQAEIHPAFEHYEISLSGDVSGVVLDGTVLSIPASVPRNIQVSVREVYAKLTVIAGNGAGTWIPAVGTHDYHYGSRVEACCIPQSPLDGTRFVCEGFLLTSRYGNAIGSGKGTNCVFVIEEDTRLLWRWHKEHEIHFCTEGPVSANFAPGWFKDGEVVISYSLLTELCELSLSGDTDGVVLDENAKTVTFPVTGPRSIVLSARSLTLPKALDTPWLPWTTDGALPWVPQVETSSDGEDAAKSGQIAGDETSGLQTTVVGPGTFGWTWKLENSDNAGVDVLLDGAWLRNYTPGFDWTEETVTIEGAGEHTIRFEFWNAGSGTVDCAYLDCVTWTGAETFGGRLELLSWEGSSATLSASIRMGGETGETEATVELAETPTFNSVLRSRSLGMVPASTNAIVVLDGFSAGTTYYARLRLAREGMDDWISGPIEFTTPVWIPAALGNVTVAHIEQHDAVVVVPIESFGPAAGSAILSATVTASADGHVASSVSMNVDALGTVSVPVSGLDAGCDYEYSVEFRLSDGTTISVSGSFRTLGGIGPTGEILVHSSGAVSADATVRLISSGDRYQTAVRGRVEFSTTAANSFDRLVAVEVPWTGPGGKEVKIPGLTRLTDYVARAVFTSEPDGLCATSSVVSFRTEWGEPPRIAAGGSGDAWIPALSFGPREDGCGEDFLVRIENPVPGCYYLVYTNDTPSGRFAVQSCMMPERADEAFVVRVPADTDSKFVKIGVSKCDIPIGTVEGNEPEAVFYVRFNANGGAGTMPDQELVILPPNGNFLSTNSFFRDGFSFYGWSTNRHSGSVADYRDGADVGTLTQSPGEIVDLWAVWGSNDPFSLALDCPDLEFYVSGLTSEGWFVQEAESHGGGSALQTVDTSPNHFHHSAISTTVNGPGTLSFWWKESDPLGACQYSSYVFIDGSIYGTKIALGDTGNEWIKKTVPVSGSGRHGIYWVHESDDYVSSECGRAWLDSVSWIPLDGGEWASEWTVGTCSSFTPAETSENLLRQEGVIYKGQVGNVSDDGFAMNDPATLTDGFVDSASSPSDKQYRFAATSYHSFRWSFPSPAVIREIRIYNIWDDSSRDRIDIEEVEACVDDKWILLSPETLTFEDGNTDGDSSGQPKRPYAVLSVRNGTPLAEGITELFIMWGTAENGYVGVGEIEVLGSFDQ